MEQFIQEQLAGRGLASFIKGDLEAMLLYACLYHSQKPLSTCISELNAQQIQSIENSFLIPHSRIDSLLRTMHRLYEPYLKTSLAKEVARALELDASGLRDGMVRINVTNPVRYDLVRQLLTEHEIFVDGSFSKDVLSFPLARVLVKLQLNETELMASLLTSLEARARAGGFVEESALQELAEHNTDSSGIKGFLRAAYVQLPGAILNAIPSALIAFLQQL